MKITVNTDEASLSTSILFDLEAWNLYLRVVNEKAPGKTTSTLIDELLTNWLAQHNTTFDGEDFAKLSPKQKKAALDAGKAAPK